jgi:hypothetical protein
MHCGKGKPVGTNHMHEYECWVQMSTEPIIGESRYFMHQAVYQHHTVKCIELM